MSLHDTSVFAGERRVNLNLFVHMLHCCITLCGNNIHGEGSYLQAILFQICYENKVRRVNNILIIGHPMTLILDNAITQI